MKEWMEWLRQANFTIYEMARIELKDKDARIAELEKVLDNAIELLESGRETRYVVGVLRQYRALRAMIEWPRENEG